MYIPVDAERTSVLAIASVVLSVLVVTAPLGVVCGVLGVMAINKARGRLAGAALAVIGVVLGTILTASMIGGAYVVLKVVPERQARQYEPLLRMVRAIEAGDAEALRGRFTPARAADVTPERMAAFRAAYEEKVGAFGDLPVGVGAMIDRGSKLAPLMQRFAADTAAFAPIPADFERGSALLVFEVDREPGRDKSREVKNVGVTMMDGDEVWLLPRKPVGKGLPWKNEASGDGK